MTKPLRALDLAGLTCDLCHGPAFASAQLADADFVDEETGWRNAWPGPLPSCLCADCESRMAGVIAQAPVLLVPVPPSPALARGKKSPKTGNRRQRRF